MVAAGIPVFIIVPQLKHQNFDLSYIEHIIRYDRDVILGYTEQINLLGIALERSVIEVRHG